MVVLLAGGARATGPVRIVAAENEYGDIAAQIGGDAVAVTSVLSDPNEDPHLFEASPSVARALAHADIAIANGAAYDPWMDKLLGATHGAAERRVIVVADLLGRRPGVNPHLWYDPACAPALARAVAGAIEAVRPGAKAAVEARLGRFLDSLAPERAEIAGLRGRYAGVAVTATEPVFGSMAAALGLVVRDEGFQVAVMNDTEPSASQTAGIEDDVRSRRVKLLLVNSQVTDSAATRLSGIAHAAGVPVVGVSETEPAGTSYQQWMMRSLDAVGRALAGG
jgi:zinc/manganese transport system substrate-binding protein